MSQSKGKFLQSLGRGKSATTAEAKEREPAARREARGASRPAAAPAAYDRLTVEEILAHLGVLTPAALTKLGDHERAHQNRRAVLAGIEARLDHEPWPGYDALDVTDVRAGLDAGRQRLDTVLAYERAHQNRAEILLAAQQRAPEGGA